MSARRVREDVELHSLFDPDLEAVLQARHSLPIPRNGYKDILGRVSANATPVTC